MPEKKQLTFGDDLRVDRFPALWRVDENVLRLIYLEIVPYRFKWEKRALVLLKSEDNGQTWNEEKRLFEMQRGKDDWIFNDYFRVSRLNDGRLILPGTIHFNETGGNSRKAIWLTSEDNGASWQGPLEISTDFPEPITNVYRVRTLPDGSLGMFGSSLENSSDALGLEKGKSRCRLLFFVSSDAGKSWRTRSVLYNGTFFPFMLCEPDFVVGRNGVLRVYTREDSGFGPGVEFVSTDGGRSWTNCPMRFMGHHIACDNLSCDRGILLVYRACHSRTLPSVGAWWDDGSAWGKYLYIDGVRHGNRYFSDVSEWIELEDGEFLVAYSMPERAEESLEVRIFTSVFSLDEFKSPTFQDANS